MILHLDPFSGIAGDMFLGLLLDLGADKGAMEGAARSVLGDEIRFSIESREVMRGPVRAIKADVIVPENSPPRKGSEITGMIARADLSGPVKERAIEAFRALIDAEAKVHGKDPGEIHLHEAGGIDAVVDIVGSAAGLSDLGVETITSGPLPWTVGEIETSHGPLPLPAPAVAELLKERPVFGLDTGFETVTPTGGAIVAAWSRFAPSPPRYRRVGHGAGSNDPPRPNILRGFIGEAASANESPEEIIEVLETHSDDASPEIMGRVIEVMMESGALDCAVTPMTMKKGRPGFGITVMARLGDGPRLARILAAESGVLGVRITRTSRLVFPRRMRAVETPWGSVMVKDGPGGSFPEYEDCLRISRERAVPLTEVGEAAARAAVDSGRGDDPESV